MSTLKRVAELCDRTTSGKHRENIATGAATTIIYGIGLGRLCGRVIQCRPCCSVIVDGDRSPKVLRERGCPSNQRSTEQHGDSCGNSTCFVLQRHEQNPFDAYPELVDVNIDQYGR